MSGPNVSSIPLHRVYTLWASMKDDEPGPWMIAAEDEYSWEGDPDRCEKVFADARKLAERNDWEVREITLRFDYAAIVAPFEPTEVDTDAAVEVA